MNVMPGRSVRVAWRIVMAALVMFGGCRRTDPRLRAAKDARAVAEQAVESGQDAAAERAWRRAARLHEDAGALVEAGHDAYEAFRIRYLDAERPDLALQQVAYAWRLAERSGDRALKRRVLKGAFAILYFVGDLATCQKAVDDFRALIEPSDSEAISVWNNNAALLDMEAGRYRVARRRLRQALAVDRQKYPGDPSFSILANLVDVNLKLGAPDAAQAHLDALLAAHGAGQDNDPVTVMLQVRVANAMGRYDAALKKADAALKAGPEPAWARDLEFARGQAHEAQGRSDLAAKAYGAAIQHVEELRRRIRIDDFKPAAVTRHRRPFEALFALHATAGRFEDALAVIDRAKGRTFLDAFFGASTHERSPSTAASFERSRQLAQGLLRLLPELRRSAARNPSNISNVLDALRGAHLLVYFRVADRLWVGTIERGKVSFEPLASKVSDLSGLIAKLKAGIDEASTAAALGERLLAVDRLPPPEQPLVIIADEPLLDLPFAQLMLDGRRLVQHRPVAYVPGVSAMASARQRSSPRTGAPVVIAAGGLAGAKDEAAWVAQRHGVMPFVARNATLDALRMAESARFLHIASHAGLGATQPWLTLEDGDVFPSTILQLGLRPGFVVLSSCISGLRRGQETWGSLGAAFLAAGADGVLASRWAIDDEATLRFIRDFYAMGGAEAPGLALAKAQRKWIADQASPEVWAAFFYLGIEPQAASRARSAVDTDTPARPTTEAVPRARP